MKQRLKHLIKQVVGQAAVDRIVGKRNEDRDLSRLSLEDRELISTIRSRNLTYLSNRKLASILTICRTTEEAQLPGVFIEAGCALGGSTILLSSAKGVGRSLLVYDVFGMIPAPTNEDTRDVHERYKVIAQGKSHGLGGDKYYGYEDNLYEIVKSNLREFDIHCERDSVTLIKGLVQETMEVNTPVAFAHIDVDWYEPVMTCLERVFPQLVAGGSIVLDDYYDWGGCRKATDEYLGKVRGQFTLDDSAGSMRVCKL